MPKTCLWLKTVHGMPPGNKQDTNSQTDLKQEAPLYGEH
nr:MAG TPA: hypothetical protein [Caudoviricetes sp.]